MSEYELRPRDVEARQITSWETAKAIATWCGGKVVEEIDPFDEKKTHPGVNIPTLEGIVRASEGDYVIRHKSGNFQRRSRFSFEQEWRAKQETVEMASDDSINPIRKVVSHDPRERWRTM